MARTLIISTFEVSQLLMSWLKLLAPANMYCTARGTREQWGLMAETPRIAEGESMLCARESRRADIQGGNARRVPSANVVVEVLASMMRAPSIVSAHAQLAEHVCERRHARNVPLTDRTVRGKPRRRVNAPQVNGCLQLRTVRKAVGRW